MVSFVCGRAVVGHQKEELEKKEKEGGLSLLEGKVEVSEESEWGAVCRAKTQECVHLFKKVS